jgi:hypothetical protein
LVHRLLLQKVTSPHFPILKVPRAQATDEPAASSGPGPGNAWARPRAPPGGKLIDPWADEDEERKRQMRQKQPADRADKKKKDASKKREKAAKDAEGGRGANGTMRSDFRAHF